MLEVHRTLHRLQGGRTRPARPSCWPSQRATQAGKIAKVRTLLTFVHNDEWRGPTADLDWEKGQTRALLGEFAGMSEDELPAI